MTTHNANGAQTVVPSILPAAENSDGMKSTLPTIRTTVEGFRSTLRSDLTTLGKRGELVG